MLRFLAWSIGSLVLLICVCAAIVRYGIETVFQDEWYTVSTASSGAASIAVVRSSCSVIDWEVPYLVYVHHIAIVYAVFSVPKHRRVRVSR